MTVVAIVLASGTGERFGDPTPKQFMKLAGLPVLVHTLQAFQDFASVSRVVVVTSESHVDGVWELVSAHCLDKVAKVVIGGATRQESSRIGLECCQDEAEYVLVHDGVRPFIGGDVLQRLVDSVRRHGAVDTVIPSADTLVRVDAQDFIAEIPDRAAFRRGQTPQAFRLDLVLQAHERALADGATNATDDCALVLRLGHPVHCVAGDEQNIKITYPLDLQLADKLFQLKRDAVLKPERELAEFFSGRAVVIFGGTDGIGRELGRLLGDCDARVFPLSRRSETAVDVTDAGSVQQAIDRIVEQTGRIDYVVNCAGDLLRKNVEFMTVDEWRHIYSVNIDGCFHVAKALIPVFKQQNYGSLMFVGSSSYTRGRGGYAAYSSSKAALVNFAQALAEELDPCGIRVNVASPGRVKTGMRFRNFGNEPEGSLLKPDYVAVKIARAMAMETTGSIFEIC
jgi:2-C-methyl-D-erythritol 4-phosphate cytidylyltransferase